jgi:mRNA interferase RelE/StbE
LAWKIEYTQTAKDQLKKLDRPVAKRVLDYLDTQIAPLDDPRSRGKALKSNLSGFWRYRVGNSRVIVEINNGELTILVIRVGNRGDVYD